MVVVVVNVKMASRDGDDNQNIGPYHRQHQIYNNLLRVPMVCGRAAAGANDCAQGRLVQTHRGGWLANGKPVEKSPFNFFGGGATSTIT